MASLHSLEDGDRALDDPLLELVGARTLRVAFAATAAINTNKQRNCTLQSHYSNGRYNITSVHSNQACPQNDLYCVRQDIKPYSLTHLF